MGLSKTFKNLTDPKHLNGRALFSLFKQKKYVFLLHSPLSTAAFIFSLGHLCKSLNSQTSGLCIFQITVYSFAETLKWFEHEWLHYSGSSTRDWTHTHTHTHTHMVRGQHTAVLPCDSGLDWRGRRRCRLSGPQAAECLVGQNLFCQSNCKEKEVDGP